MAQTKKKSVKTNRPNGNAQPVKKKADNHDEPISTKNMVIITVVIAVLILCFTTVKLVKYDNAYYMCIRTPIQPNAGSTVLFEHTHETREYLIETDFDPELERDTCMKIWGISIFSFGN